MVSMQTNFKNKLQKCLKLFWKILRLHAILFTNYQTGCLRFFFKIILFDHANFRVYIIHIVSRSIKHAYYMYSNIGDV